MPGQPDYYEILQVHRSAEPEVVQAAYRRLSLKYHPDVYKGADAQRRMALLNEAYGVLSDPQKRARYDRDRFGAVGQQQPSQSSPALQAYPREIDLGPVPAGRNRVASVHVRNVGQGTLSGLAVSHVPWLQVSPAEFSSNELDIVLRFQPGVPGDYTSPNAVEIYSNGGRTTVSVRGSLGASAPSYRAGSRPAGDSSRSAAGPRGMPARRSPADVARPQVAPGRVPFIVWVLVGTAISSAIWFLIAPALAAIPVGLGVWLGWEHLFVRSRRTEGGAQQRVSSAALGRCLACGATSDPARARKCQRCGGSICPSCGACPCRRRAS